MNLTQKVTSSALSLAIVGSMFTPAMVNASDWYVGGAFGYSKTNVPKQDINQSLNQAGQSVGVDSLSDSGTSTEVFVGYQLSDIFALEVGYLNLGDRDIVLSGDILDSSSFYDTVEHIYPDTGKGATLGVIATYPLSDHWYIGGKVALFHWQQDYDLTVAGSKVGADSAKGTDVLLGAELGYQLTKQFQINTSISTVSLENDNVNNITLGVRYSF